MISRITDTVKEAERHRKKQKNINIKKYQNRPLSLNIQDKRGKKVQKGHLNTKFEEGPDGRSGHWLIFEAVEIFIARS